MMDSNYPNYAGQMVGATRKQEAKNATLASMPSPAAPLEGAMRRLDGAVDELMATVDLIQTRVASLLIPEQPVTAGNASKVGSDYSVSSPHVATVNNQADRVRRATAQLHDVISRLEV